MTGGRTLLAQTLKAGLPGWLVVADARQLDTVPKPGACVLWTAKRIRPGLSKLSVLTDELTLWVLTATDKPALLEDDLDELLQSVLDVLEEAPAFTWSEAERGVLADRFEGWRLTVSCLYLVDPDPTD